MSRLQRFRVGRRCTLLGVGPMSRNCVDVTLELSRERHLPLMLIASRQQIECAELGGGYVEGWTTESFVSHVRSLAPSPVLLARDHGGPWQHAAERALGMELDEAMRRAKTSYAADIEAGFDLVHIDASHDPSGSASVDQLLDRVFELYEFCHATARRQGRELLFEVGTDEQSAEFQDPGELEYVLTSVNRFCASESLPRPTFVVVQTGTRVLETENVGGLRVSTFPRLRRLLELCRAHRIWLKEHNADYLPRSALRGHPRVGIDAVNIAPELGVVETRAFLRLLRCHSLGALAERFLELAYDSGCWRKWLKPASRLDAAGRAILAGHYVFAASEFRELKARASRSLLRWSVDVDAVLRASIRRAIERYLDAFGLTRARPQLAPRTRAAARAAVQRV
ncbi:MAG: class II D-tagatose-bisphosphate aldolase non-catalytic subunit [Myxococcota bacterium]